MANKKHYILCADDDPLNNNLVEAYLDNRYELKFVNNGQECLDAIDERKPDLVLLDVMMPVIDGKEVCRRLKSSIDNKNIPIVVLSASSYEDDINSMFEVGVNDYITKPFLDDELIFTLDKVLS